MARSLLVVNYPTFATADLEKIQSVRRQHDALYADVVAPHFTLVFPVFNLDETSFINHVKQVTQSIPTFDIVIRCATLGDDAFSDYTHVFLVPDEGYSHIVRLHVQSILPGFLAGCLCDDHSSQSSPSKLSRVRASTRNRQS